MRQKGFTLLEVLVATLIMGVAVVGLLSAISTSLHNATRLSDYDRVALLARAQMDALLLNRRLPPFSIIQGAFDPALAGGLESGWRARLTPFEMPPNRGAGTFALERVELEVWWMSGGGNRRTFTLDAFRRIRLRPDELAGLGNPTP
jgi:general secretion pathway protein I